VSIVSEAREKLKVPDSALLPAILVMATLYFGREVFVPLALAALLAFLLVPVSALLERWGMRRTPSGLLVVFLSLVAVTSLGWIMLGQIYNLAVELPQYQQNINQKIESLHLHSAGRLSNTLAMLTEETKQLRGDATPAPTAALPDAPRPHIRSRSKAASEPNKDQLSVPTDQPLTVRVEQPEESVVSLANRTIAPLIHPLTTTFVVVVFLAFMLVGREDLRDRGIRLAGRGRMQVTTSAIEDAGRRVGRYLRMQLIVNVVFGFIAGSCLWLIGVPNPLLWGLLICLLRFVPYIGIFLAAIGPLILSIAVSPHWGVVLWTVFLFLVLELITGNVVEPLLYSSSTGLSPIAVLIAAIFWTLLWGLPGLLLSTPLTVCLVVIGRQFPHLQYLDVLFGDETALPPPERFYQRLLSSNNREARALLDGLFASKSKEQVYDSVVIPVLTLIEESRHAEELTSSRAEEVLLAVEELAEDVASHIRVPEESSQKTPKLIMCIPARDLADEVACQLACHVLSPTCTVRVIAADISISDVLQTIDSFHADAICVVGIPPQSLRHIRLRCHQVRARFPEAIVFACLLSEQCDLSNIRSRVPTEDAQHVVCSLQLMEEYLTTLLYPAKVPEESVEESDDAAKAREDLASSLLEMQRMDVLDESEEDAFQRLASNLARSFDAPIALVTAAQTERHIWEAQCGLPDDALSFSDAMHDPSVLTHMVSSESILIIPDTAEDPISADQPFLRERGIRFYAAVPLKSHDGKVMGSLCVLDTRPRQITEKQKEMLHWIAEVVTTAIELKDATPPAEPASAKAEIGFAS
jgi:predicted PurR-regulated permease PerM/GAF domain-containing protein